MPGKSGSGSGGGNFGSLRSGGNRGSGGCGTGGCGSGFGEGGNPNPASRKFRSKLKVRPVHKLKELGRCHNTANTVGKLRALQGYFPESRKKKTRKYELYESERPNQCKGFSQFGYSKGRIVRSVYPRENRQVGSIRGHLANRSNCSAL